MCYNGMAVRTVKRVYSAALTSVYILKDVKYLPKYSCFSKIRYTFAAPYMEVRAFSSAGLEHLPYKQRVGGSNPSTPTTYRTGGYQSGQMGQTVNLLAMPSVVRIHHHPRFSISD